MSIRSQSLRIARALSRELTNPSSAQRICSVHRPLIANQSVSVQTGFLSTHNYNLRSFSTKPEEDAKADDAQSAQEPAASDEAAKESTDADADADGESSPAEEIAKLEAQIKDLKDNLLLSLADQENTRRIAQRDVSNAKSFAVASFAKSLLDTHDNLSRALDAVPEDLRHDHENHPVLANLYEGISMTDDGLAKAFGKNGLVKFGERGEKFDPNLHEALFEYPDEEGEAGHIGQVMKVGFMLNKRVVRPAEVGVVKSA